MIPHLNRRYRFSASHRLHADALSVEENPEVFGKCNNPHGHGHNYMVTVTFSGPVSPLTGMVTNLADLDAFAAEHLLAHYDLTNLNAHLAFERAVPTTENLVVELQRIFAGYPGAILENIHVEETGNNSFDLKPDHSFHKLDIPQR